jgi:hypothetical protein
MNSILDLDGKQGTYISVTGAQTRIRGGGYGSDAWLARLVGLDDKFTFKREFVQKEDHRSGSGKSGTIVWTIKEPGIYEWRKLCVGSTGNNWESSGFCRISDDGIERLTKEEAIEAVKSMSSEAVKGVSIP